MASDESTCQQPETVIPEVSSVLEEIVMTVAKATDNAGRPKDISMLHDYAMEHLFSFLPMADLKNCRLVNRSWNRASNRAIQKRKYFIRFGNHFGPPNQVQIYQVEDIPKLHQLVRASFQFPWTKFWMDCTTSTRVGTLLRVIHPFVTELDTRNLLNLQSFEYPNLRKLTLWYDSRSIPTGNNWTSLLRLVETASNLNEVAITGKCKTPLFMDILEIANCRNISRLSLSRWMGDEHIVRLSEMGLQLKFLRLDFELTEVTADSVRAVLQSQSNCLEHLELICCRSFYAKDNEVDPQWRLGLEFPCMGKLKMLWVQAANVYSRISYKDMFPALKMLKVYGDNALDDCFFNGEIEPVETVEYLMFANWPRSPERILQAARQFPKLRCVVLFASQNVLNIVGRAMSRLEEVELTFNRYNNMDSLLTGLSSEEVDTLKDLPVSQLDAVERNKEPVHFLKNLKMLRLSSRAGRTVVTSLSDFGCRFALLKMERLQVLELRGNFSNISAEVMERMRKKFVVRLEN